MSYLVARSAKSVQIFGGIPNPKLKDIGVTHHSLPLNKRTKNLIVHRAYLSHHPPLQIMPLLRFFKKVKKKKRISCKNLKKHEKHISLVILKKGHQAGMKNRTLCGFGFH